MTPSVENAIPAGRWCAIKADLQFGFMAFQALQFARAEQTTDAAYAQAVANHCAMHLLHVLEATVAQDDSVRCDKVSVFEQQQVHGWVAGGWSCLSESSSGWSSG